MRNLVLVVFMCVGWIRLVCAQTARRVQLTLDTSEADKALVIVHKQAVHRQALRGQASGKDLHRPELEQLTGYVCKGDTAICHSMDRLARNLDDLRTVVLGFAKRGVHVRFEK